MEEAIAIRSIQHYLYCPHRWGLMEIDRAWAENGFVTKSNLLHDRVHDPDRSYAQQGKKVFTGVWVYNDAKEYNLYGVTDCIEATQARDGVVIGKDGVKYRLCIVEYKPTQPKEGGYREDDLMQVFAQKICVDAVFGCDCSGVLYYADAKKRVQLPLKENFALYDQKLKKLLCEMRERRRNGNIPPVRKGQFCSGCSMKDLCMPSLKSAVKIRARILKQSEEAV